MSTITDLNPDLLLTEFQVNTGVLLDTSVSVSNPDGTNFFGGEFRVSLSGSTGDDTLAIAEIFGITLSAGNTIGSQVSFAGTVIGTITSDGTAGSDLAVSLNSEAFDGRVQVLSSVITFSNSSSTPPSTTRIITYQLTDADADVGTATIDLTISPSVAPTVTGLESPLGLTEFQANNGVFLDTSVSVSNPDGTNFFGGEFRVSLSGSTGDDTLAIAEIFGITLSAGNTIGSQVSFAGTVIGTITSDGTAGSDLAVSLNSEAFDGRVQVLSSVITFSNSSSTPPSTTRIITYQLTDADADVGTATIDLTISPSVAPTVTGLESPLGLTEFQANNGVFLDTSVSVSNPDGTNFFGGEFRVSLSGSTGDDTLAIAEIFGITLSAGNTIGSQVSFAGTVIGTITSDGTAGSDLAVSLNSEAFDGRVQVLSSVITFSNSSSTPPSTTRIITYQLTDADADVGTATIDLTISPSVAPTVTGLESPLGLTEFQANNGVFLDTSVSVSNPDGTNFFGGEFRVSLSGSTGDDTLAIAEIFGITLSAGNTIGSQVSFAGTVIGTITSDGTAGSDLAVSLNSEAFDGRVQVLSSVITFSNSSSTPPSTTRIITYQLTDADADVGTATIDLTISPSVAPTVTGLESPLGLTEFQANNGVFLDTSVSVSNPDGTNFFGGEFRVSLSGSTGDDTLAIAEIFGITLSAGNTIGSQVSFAGTVIGTITSDGTAGSDLAVSLNSEAFDGRVQVLSSVITFSNSSSTPPSTTRIITYQLTDADADVGTATIDLTISPSVAPTVTGLESPLGLTEFQANNGVFLDTSVSVSNPDGTNFFGGEFRVSLSGSTGDDTLAIAEIFGITLSAGNTIGSQVSFAGTVIGTITSDGTAGSDLAVSLNSEAFDGRVQVLSSVITFSNSSSTPPSTTRIITYQLTDADADVGTATIDLTITPDSPPVNLIEGDEFDNDLTGLGTANNDKYLPGANGGIFGDYISASGGNDEIDFTGAELSPIGGFYGLDYRTAGAITVTLSPTINEIVKTGSIAGTDTLSNVDLVGAADGGLFLRSGNGDDSYTVDTSQVSYLFIRAGTGMDTIDRTGTGTLRVDLSPYNGVTVDADAGTATEINGSAQTNVMGFVNEWRGSAGNDSLIGRTADFNERFITQAGFDFVDGGGTGDNDVLRYDRFYMDDGGGTINIVVEMTGVGSGTVSGVWYGQYFEDTFINIETIRGSQVGVDIFQGSTGAETFEGEGGANIYVVDGGSNTIVIGANSYEPATTANIISFEPGGFGTVTIEGFVPGRDLIDTIAYGPLMPGVDVVYDLGTGNTTITPAGGGTIIVEGVDLQNQPLLDWAIQNENMSATSGDDSNLLGTSQNDKIDGLAGSDNIFGDDGNDILLSGGAPLDDNADGDYLDGGAGNDLLVAEGGVVNMIGGAGNDVLVVTNEFGDPDYDFALANYRSSTSGITANLTANTVDGLSFGQIRDGLEITPGVFGIDTVSGVHVLVDSTHDDFIYVDDSYANSFGNFIEVRLSEGNDTVDFTNMFGVARVSWRGAQDGVNASLITGIATDANTRTGTDPVSGLLYSAQDDIGTDTFINANQLRGSNYADTLTGNDGDNRLRGQGGDDTLNGGAGNDRLEGDGGSDTIDGGDNDDTLIGGTGNDILIGGDDADLFVFAPGDGLDTITDFNFGDGDRIDVSAYGFTASSQFTIDTTTILGSTILDFNGTDTVTLNGVDLSTFTPGDLEAAFIFTSGPYIINGTLGDDDLTGLGTAGNDKYLPGANGGIFGDYISASGGNDEIDFTGAELSPIGGFYGLDYRTAGAITVTLSPTINEIVKTGSIAGTDTLSNVDLVGAADGGLFLRSGNGDDSYTVDTSQVSYLFIRAGTGMDTIDRTGTGTLRVDLSPYNGVTVDADAGTATEINGSAQTNVMGFVNEWRGSAGNDSLIGRTADFNERFITQAGFDFVDGGGTGDNDVLRYDRFYMDDGGGTINIVVEMTGVGSGTVSGVWYGQYFEDTFINIETIRGSQVGVDIFQGSTGAETFEGEGGANIYVVDGGSNTIVIGANSYEPATTANIISFEPGGFGTVTIEGFVPGRDLIDTIAYGPLMPGVDVVYDLGTGNTTITPAGGGTIIVEGVDLQNQPLLDWAIQNENMSATSGDDSNLLGTSQNDKIDGLAGSDNIFGDDGNDILLSGGAPLDDNADGDYLDGGAGNDLLVAEGGVVNMIGGAGNDVLVVTNEFGDPDYDFALANYRSSTSGITANLTANTVDGLSFGQIRDGLEITPGVFGIDTVSGVHVLVDSTHDDFIYVDDSYANSFGNFIEVRLSEGNDTVDFTNMFGVARVSWRGAQDGVNASLITGIATDANTRTGTDPVSGLLYSAQDDIGTDTFINANQLRGSNYADTLTGNDGDNRLRGQGGDDTLNGGLGNDRLEGDGGSDTLYSGGAPLSNSGQDSLDGGEGDDTLHAEGGAVDLIGGAGNDTYVITSADPDWDWAVLNYSDVPTIGVGTLGIVANLTSGTPTPVGALTAGDIPGSMQIADGQGGIDTIDMVNGDGAHVIQDSNNDDYIFVDGSYFIDGYDAFGGPDYNFLEVRLSGGNDYVEFSSDFEDGRVSWTFAYDGVNASLLTGTAVDNDLSNGDQIGTDTFVGANQLRGSNFADVLIGDDGNNRLRGQGGDDEIVGGLGNDRLEGGGGADTFVFNQGDGQDRIDDFNYLDGDRIDVSDYGVSDSTGFTFTPDGLNLIIDFDGAGPGTDQVRLINPNLAGLVDNDDAFIF